MEKLQNLSGINTNTIEGRLLMAALAKITTESQTDKTPDEVLNQCHELAEYMYKDAGDLPPTEQERPNFEKALSSLINRYSLENGSDTPDFILSKYLLASLTAYQDAVRLRDDWFSVDMWAEDKRSVANVAE